MALHNLKIVVVDGGRAGSYTSKNVGGEIGDTERKDLKTSPLYKALNAKQTIKEKAKNSMTPTQVFAMNMGVQVAGQLIRQTANYYISDIGRRNGDSNYQAIINRQIETVTDTLGLFGSALAGAAVGSAIPGVGSAIGLVAGFASSAISLGFKYAERERAYQHTMFKENNNQAYNMARASSQGFTGRLR